MRRLNVAGRKTALNVVKELDAFPKVPDTYQETTASGGGLSIVVFVVIAVLIFSEVKFYRDTRLKFDYQVDTNFSAKLKINVDMTVAMKCNLIGADVLDMTGQNAVGNGELKQDPVVFALDGPQRMYLDMMQNVNNYVRNEYHAIHELLWKTGFNALSKNMPPRSEATDKEADGCRVHGHMWVNKVAGNFHITAGRSVNFMGGHAHMSTMMDRTDYNFSHRIDQFSYGDAVAGIINPLDGEEKTTTQNYHMYQYFVQVVPTKVHTSSSKLDSYQYAVTERDRTIDHSSGSHGVPGIFVKYDLSPLQISVTEVHPPYWQFLVRLCGIVGGVFATSGMLHGLVGFVVDVFCCRYKIGKYHSEPVVEQLPPQQLPSNDLLSNDVATNEQVMQPGISLLNQTPHMNNSTVLH